MLMPQGRAEERSDRAPHRVPRDDHASCARTHQLLHKLLGVLDKEVKRHHEAALACAAAVPVLLERDKNVATRCEACAQAPRSLMSVRSWGVRVRRQV
jgi:hypothetical protein